MQQAVKSKFESYPLQANARLLAIRSLIFEIAKEKNLGAVTEELKWGEPSYKTKVGSPVRIDWKAKSPDSISIFVHCQTLLVETYKEIFGNALRYSGNRQIVLPLSEPLPELELRACLTMALEYHRVKHLPLLGFGRCE